MSLDQLLLENFIGNYFGGSFQKLISFFALENDMDIRELEGMLKYVEKDIQNQKNHE